MILYFVVIIITYLPMLLPGAAAVAARTTFAPVSRTHAMGSLPAVEVHFGLSPTKFFYRQLSGIAAEPGFRTTAKHSIHRLFLGRKNAFYLLFDGYFFTPAQRLSLA
jgi:hypothetical protein